MSDSTPKEEEYFESSGGSGDFSFQPNPGGSFIQTGDDNTFDPAISGGITYPPPSSLAQFITLDLVLDYERDSEHTVEYLFNMDQIIYFGGPDEYEDCKPGYFIVESVLDQHIIKGDWDSFKRKLQTIATLWD